MKVSVQSHSVREFYGWKEERLRGSKVYWDHLFIDTP